MGYVHTSCSLVILLATVAFSSAAMGGRIELEVCTEEGLPPLTQQSWVQSLSRVGIDNVRIHTRQAQEKVGVEVQGAGRSTVYVVTGIVNSDGELVLPGGKYRSDQASAAARWLKDLAEHGPAKGERSQKAVMGLSLSKLERVAQTWPSRSTFLP